MQYILTKTTFTGVTKDNRTITMSNDNPNWDDLYESILDKDWDEVEELCSLSLTVERYGKVKLLSLMVLFNLKVRTYTIH